LKLLRRTCPRHAGWLGAALAALFAALPARAETEPPPGPAAVVERWHQTLLEAGRLGEEAGFEQRRALLAPVVRDVFDAPLMARLSLASHWKALADRERSNFIDLVRRYTVANYAARFDRLEAARFEILQVRELREDVRAVRTRFVSGRGKTRRFDYQLRRAGEQWRIVNVAVDGVSELAVRRAEYSDLYERDGFDGLAERVREQIEALPSSDTDD